MPLFFLVLNSKSDFSDNILPRGFTGHEHFSEIALIHMNGRMYDPQMRRFLSPDNNIPDPFDTRSFDRFGYVWNNPLMNVDPSGEELATILLIAKILYAAFKVTQTTIRYVEGDYRGPIPGLLTVLNVVITFTGNPFVEGGVIDFGLSEGLNEVLTLASTVAFFELNELAARNQSGSVFNKPLETMVVEPEFESNSSNSMNSTTNSMGNTTNLTSYGSLNEEIPNPFDPYNQESFLESSIPNLGNITIGGGSSGGIGIGPITISPIGNGVEVPEANEGDEEEEENPCGEGFVQGINGNCYEIPCPGDPVPNPEIAPQTRSGVSGGLFGTCTRDYEYSICATKKRYHQGVDILNKKNQPVFAMFDGMARLQEQDGGAGHHISITSTVNGKTVRHVYFHLQDKNRVSGPVKAGDIIGYQGESGNLAGAIKKGLTQSHVHVKVEENGKRIDPLDYFNTQIDPETGTVTTPCKN